MPAFIFSDWTGVLRMLVIAPAAYVAVIAIVRMTGKRSLSKLNAFDFIVTVALGSTLASVITTESLALFEGVTALALLVGLQFLVTTLSVRWPAFDRVVKAEPALLLRHGRPLAAAMRRERITREELEAAVRQAGGRSLSDAEAVVLETDGTLTGLMRKS
jgi:uncharacterized membrane protein YcaP (DUF421 family)